MLNIYEGVPGAGKTYLAVYDITKICEYDEFHERYRVKDGDLIVTNIKELKIEHIDLDEAIKKHGFKKFFSYEMFQSLREKYKRVVIVIDEAQRYFTRDTVDKDVAYAFEYHRHAGIDITLITQDSRNLPRRLTALPEYIVSAYPRSLNLGYRFTYEIFDTKARTSLWKKHIKKDQRII